MKTLLYGLCWILFSAMAGIGVGMLTSLLPGADLSYTGSAVMGLAAMGMMRISLLAAEIERLRQAVVGRHRPWRGHNLTPAPSAAPPDDSDGHG